LSANKFADQLLVQFFSFISQFRLKSVLLIVLFYCAFLVSSPVVDVSDKGVLEVADRVLRGWASGADVVLLEVRDLVCVDGLKLLNQSLYGPGVVELKVLVYQIRETKRFCFPIGQPCPMILKVLYR
jgi:hypothetical protein